MLSAAVAAARVSPPRCLTSSTSTTAAAAAAAPPTAAAPTVTPARLDKPPPYTTLFFGTDWRSAHVLRALHQNMLGERGATPLVRHLEVVTSPGSARNSVAEYARAHSLPVHTVMGNTMRGWKMPPPPADSESWDVGVVYSFGFLVPSAAVRSFAVGAFNAHGSLLPRHRGAAPVQHAILSGDTETGVTVIELAPLFDHGRLLLRSEPVPITSETCYEDLAATLSEVAAECSLRTLERLPQLLRDAQPQDMERATLAAKITGEDARIRWDTRTADEILRQARALPVNLPLWTLLNPRLRRVNLVTLQPAPETVTQRGPPGSFYYSKVEDAIVIECKQGRVLATQLQPDSGRPCSALAFNNGFARAGGHHTFAGSFSSADKGEDPKQMAKRDEEPKQTTKRDEDPK